MSGAQSTGRTYATYTRSDEGDVCCALKGDASILDTRRSAARETNIN